MALSKCVWAVDMVIEGRGAQERDAGISRGSESHTALDKGSPTTMSIIRPACLP